MAGTEGLGGPCPNCGEMNCFIKKGTGTWYTFITCPDCFFAYGENADNMMEETYGIVTGSSVWKSLIYARGIESVEEIKSWRDDNDKFTVDSPFDLSEANKWVLNLCMCEENIIEDIIENADREEMYNND